jgi:hypothetical protein
MKVSTFAFDSRRGAARFGWFALPLSAVLTLSAQAQTTTTTPRAELENSVITSTTNTVNAVRVPVLNSEGVVSYDDITFTVEVNDDGVVTFGPTSVITSAPIIQTDHFVPGTYAGPGGSPTIAVTGPGVVSGGATEWSSAQSGTTCSAPGSATWYVGPISDNPLYSRLKKAGISSTAYSYGILGTYCGGPAWWFGGSILGFSQTGKSLTIVSFTYDGTDQSTPGAQITYTMN